MMSYSCSNISSFLNYHLLRKDESRFYPVLLAFVPYKIYIILATRSSDLMAAHDPMISPPSVMREREELWILENSSAS